MSHSIYVPLEIPIPVALPFAVLTVAAMVTPGSICDVCSTVTVTTPEGTFSATKYSSRLNRTKTLAAA